MENLYRSEHKLQSGRSVDTEKVMEHNLVLYY